MRDLDLGAALALLAPPLAPEEAARILDAVLREADETHKEGSAKRRTARSYGR